MYMLFVLFVSRLSFFFFNGPATTEIYTLSLHDALPIFNAIYAFAVVMKRVIGELLAHNKYDKQAERHRHRQPCKVEDRKSTRLNSSHSSISYAVFCLKKKKNKHRSTTSTAAAATAIRFH